MNPADWRTESQRAEDAQLRGGWWRCSEHGLTHNPLMLGSHAYCPRDDCTNERPLLLAHSVMQDKSETSWNDGPRGKPGRPKRVDQVDEDAVEAGPGRRAPKPELEVDVPEPTIMKGAKGFGARAFIPAFLERQPGREATRATLLAAFAAARPDLGDRAARNFDAATAPLRRQGKIIHTGNGWRLPSDAPTPERSPPTRRRRNDLAERIAETSAPDSDRPGASSEVAEGETPSPKPTPTRERRYPRVPTGNDGFPQVPVVDETSGSQPSASTESAERKQPDSLPAAGEIAVDAGEGLVIRLQFAHPTTVARIRDVLAAIGSRGA